MILTEMSKNLLDKGLLLRIIYTDDENIKRFTYIMLGEWLDKFKIKQSKCNKNKIYDVILSREFNLDGLKIDCLEYPYLPTNFDLNVFLFQNISIIDYEKNYEDNLKVVLYKLIEEYEEQKKFFYRDIKNFNCLSGEELNDFLILRFYPKYKNNHNGLFQEIENDINQKYFTMPFQNVNKEDCNIPSDIYAFRSLFGISKKNETTKDKVFLDALKRRWMGLMINHKNDIFNELKNTDISFLTVSEKQAFYEELEDYENSISIKISDFDEFKTPIEVISYWEPHLQPIPCFVYV
jgi:hypothetical protein